MLVLTRKTNESIMIGDDIEITVVAINDGRVRIGIDAPRSTPVYRREVYLDIHGADALPPARTRPAPRPIDPAAERRTVRDEIDAILREVKAA